jgi:hypothetical protein
MPLKRSVTSRPVDWSSTSLPSASKMPRSVHSCQRLPCSETALVHVRGHGHARRQREDLLPHRLAVLSATSGRKLLPHVIGRAAPEDAAVRRVDERARAVRLPAHDHLGLVFDDDAEPLLRVRGTGRRSFGQLALAVLQQRDDAAEREHGGAPEREAEEERLPAASCPSSSPMRPSVIGEKTFITP